LAQAFWAQAIWARAVLIQLLTPSAQSAPLVRLMPRFAITPKLSPEDEAALLKSLRLQREKKQQAALQAESLNLARLKLADVAIEKVPEEAAALVSKDKKNFGMGNEREAVVAITLCAVLQSASKAEEVSGKGKGKKAPKAKAKPKIGAKVERLPPPTGDAAAEAIIMHKATLAQLCNVKHAKTGEAMEKETQIARQALLTAFAAWLCNEYNEPVLAEAPKLLQTLSSEGLLEREMLNEYWTKVLSTRESDSAELLAAKALCKETLAEVGSSAELLKRSKKEDEDAVLQAKWAAAEVSNARCGNQPSDEEVAREKAAAAGDSKARSTRLLAQKKVELAHKEQVAALNANEAAIKDLAAMVVDTRTCELMHQYLWSFFESKPPPPSASQPPAEPEAAQPEASQPPEPADAN